MITHLDGCSADLGEHQAGPVSLTSALPDPLLEPVLSSSLVHFLSLHYDPQLIGELVGKDFYAGNYFSPILKASIDCLPPSVLFLRKSNIFATYDSVQRTCYLQMLGEMLAATL